MCECCESRGIDGKGIEMAEVNFTSITIDEIVDLGGLPLPGFNGFATLELSEANLILDNQNPDGGEIHVQGRLRGLNSSSDCNVGVRDFNVVFIP